MTKNEPFLSEDDKALLRRSRYPELTDDQFTEFMHNVDRFRLDPFTNQIRAVLRNSKQRGPDGKDVWVKKMTVQTGIDGYRLIADRTGAYAGSDDAVTTYGAQNELAAACVTVYKMVGQQRCPFGATARWEEYVPGEKQQRMWLKMPHVMLSKCAEALALRKAFPAELSGLYTDAEMDQADGLKAADLSPVVNGTAKPMPLPPGESFPEMPEGVKVREALADFFEQGSQEATVEEKRELIRDFAMKMQAQNIQGNAAVILSKIVKQELESPKIRTQAHLLQVREAIDRGKYTLDSGEVIPDAA